MNEQHVMSGIGRTGRGATRRDYYGRSLELEFPPRNPTPPPNTDVLGFALRSPNLFPTSQVDFEDRTKGAFVTAEENLEPGKCLDLNKSEHFPFVGMFLRKGQPGEYFVQSLSDMENRTQNGLRLQETQGRYVASYDGHEINWQSPLAQHIYQAMLCLSRSIGGRRMKMLMPLPMPK
jgi:hypothetical protein